MSPSIPTVPPRAASPGVARRPTYVMRRRDRASTEPGPFRFLLAVVSIVLGSAAGVFAIHALVHPIHLRTIGADRPCTGPASCAGPGARDLSPPR